MAECSEVGLDHGRQMALQGHHVAAKQMPKRRVQGPPASGVEQRRDISERVARHEERDPVYMRPLMQEFLAERREKWHFRSTSSTVPAVFVKCVPRTQ
jgi:hypothetical protein